MSFAQNTERLIVAWYITDLKAFRMAKIYGRWLAGIAASNPAGGKDVSLL
jgi:hypothetical protein